MGSTLKIKELRLRNKMKQKQLADMMNVASNTISTWEQGTREPSCEDLKKLADIFEVSLDYLMGRKNTNQNQSLTDEQEKLINEFNELNKPQQQMIREIISAFFMQQAARIFGNVINSNGGEVRNCFNGGNNCVMS